MGPELKRAGGRGHGGASAKPKGGRGGGNRTKSAQNAADTVKRHNAEEKNEGESEEKAAKKAKKDAELEVDLQEEANNTQMVVLAKKAREAKQKAGTSTSVQKPPVIVEKPDNADYDNGDTSSSSDDVEEVPNKKGGVGGVNEGGGGGSGGVERKGKGKAPMPETQEEENYEDYANDSGDGDRPNTTPPPKSLFATTGT